MNSSRSTKGKDISSSQVPILILMARWHGIKRCKTRLSKTIGALKASRIQEKLTKHTISVALDLAQKEFVEIKIAFSGIGINAATRWGLDQGLKHIGRQSDGNLGTKMRREVLKNQPQGKKKNQHDRTTILIGTDLPTLSTNDLRQAIEVLRHKDMVIGPAYDGGYWLIGFSNKIVAPIVKWPFCGIKWGSNEVLKETIRMANLNKVDYELLNPQNDLDKIEDLNPWQISNIFPR